MTLSMQQLAREVDAAGLQMTADSATLLKYAILPDPNPMQVSAANARLTLVISNPGGQVVTCTKLEVTLPVGTNAKALITGGSFQTVPPDGWSATSAGGVITLTPQTPAAGEIGRTGLALVVAALPVNAEPGVAPVTIDETASSASAPPPAQTRTATIDVAKFPRQFQLGPLLAEPLEVPYDGSTLISWSGSPAAYSLRYTSASGSQVVDNLPPVGSHSATHLVSFPCVFTLVVKVTVAGLDAPLVLQRQVSVSAAPKLAISYFAASATLATAATPIVFRWETQFATKCTLRVARGDEGVDVTAVRTCTLTLVPTNGKRFDVVGPDGKKLGTIGLPAAVEASLTFVLSATGGDGNSVQATFDVVVRPVTCELTSSYHGYMGWTIGWKATNSAGDVVLTPLGKVDPNGPKDGYKLVPRDTYTLTANGFWGPAVQTVKLT